jgi:hypothetical protein
MEPNMSLKEQDESNDINKKQKKIKNTKKEKEKEKEHHALNKINILENRPKKRTRDYSPSMDIDDDEEETSNNKTKVNGKNRHKNKKMKVPLIKLVERIELNDKEDKDINKNKKKISKKALNKKSRGIKIFSDMSVSEISNNLFKNFYPCLLPPYYPEQISAQIIDNQLEKLISNVNKSSKNNESNKKNNIIKMNMDYLRELAEKQGEWITDDCQDQIFYDREYDYEDENNDYDPSDSNDENNPNNSYPEDESIENEDDNVDEFGDKYDDYDNNDDYDD